MGRRHADRLQRFGIEPVVPVAKAEACDEMYLAIDDGELEFAIERGGLDVAPSRRVKQPNQCGRNSFHDDQVSEMACSGSLTDRASGRFDFAQCSRGLRSFTEASGFILREPT